MKRSYLIAFALIACGGGAPGPQGQQGPQGPPGPSGIAVVSNRFCQKASSAIIYNLLYTYQVVRYSNGDALVLCSVSDGRASYSESAYWQSTQRGSHDGSCLGLGYDVDNGNVGGYFAFQDDPPGPRVIYHDSDNPSQDGRSVTFAASDCG